jgi:hypothetical protein
MRRSIVTPCTQHIAGMSACVHCLEASHSQHHMTLLVQIRCEARTVLRSAHAEVSSIRGAGLNANCRSEVGGEHEAGRRQNVWQIA